MSNCEINYECSNCDLTIFVVVCSLHCCECVLACKEEKCSHASIFLESFLICV